MIHFTCPTCTKPFKVPDEFAGRTARCKTCGAALTVPAASTVVAAPTPVPAPTQDSALRTQHSPRPTPSSPHAPTSPPSPQPHARVPMRTRRLLADAQHMADAFSHSDKIRLLAADGDPPDRYRVEYRIHSLGPTADPDHPAPRDVHQVEIQLTADYPRSAPSCKMLTPVYHPNIDPSHVCVGDHWAAGERLVDLVVRIGEMLAYQAYNIKSPLDAHAAMWADLNQDKLPTDARTIRPAELE
ncbi:MAG TPA: ubiquitin-conjugating enzyme E2 [Tepidisphaeraceae bacterium]|nr:ubiquitin-conjugating enzyme E2 [Tepidisphaeraceae bacterium]